MSNRSLRAALMFYAALFFWNFSAWAGTDELEALMNKSLNEARAAGAKYENHACGHFYFADGEYVKLGPDGKAKNYPIQWNPIDPWGCNNRPPSNVNVTSKFESRQTMMEDGTDVQHIGRAYGTFYFDPEPSTEIAGAVVDKDSRPVKNAEVMAEDMNRSIPPIVARTNAEGKYSLMVSSGQYRVTAKTQECSSQPQTLWVCGWGMATEAHIRKERFPLDLVLGCGGLMLNISGPYTNTVDAQIEGVSLSGATTGGEVEGHIPLSLDPQTGEVSGEGSLRYHSIGMNLSGMAEGIPMRGNGSAALSDWQVKVHGRVDPATGIASLSCDCAQFGSTALTATVQAGPVTQTASSTDPSGGCSGADWRIEFEIPWKEGESYYLDRILSWNIEGIAVDRHETFDLTLGEKKEGGNRSEPPAPRGGHQSRGGSGGSGSQGGSRTGLSRPGQGNSGSDRRVARIEVIEEYADPEEVLVQNEEEGSYDVDQEDIMAQIQDISSQIGF